MIKVNLFIKKNIMEKKSATPKNPATKGIKGPLRPKSD